MGPGVGPTSSSPPTHPPPAASQYPIYVIYFSPTVCYPTVSTVCSNPDLMGPESRPRLIACPPLPDVIRNTDLQVSIPLAHHFLPFLRHFTACSNPDLMGPEVRSRVVVGLPLPLAMVPTPLVDLPLGATEDRICGTIDFERALSEGKLIMKTDAVERKKGRTFGVSKEGNGLQLSLSPHPTAVSLFVSPLCLQASRHLSLACWQGPTGVTGSSCI